MHKETVFESEDKSFEEDLVEHKRKSVWKRVVYHDDFDNNNINSININVGKDQLDMRSIGCMEEPTSASTNINSKNIHMIA